jgi:TonB family protein
MNADARLYTSINHSGTAAGSESSTVLMLALVGSVAIHVAFAALHFGHQGQHGVDADERPPLITTLARVPQPVTPPAVTEVIPVETASPTHVTATPFDPVASLLQPASSAAAEKRVKRNRGGVLSELRVNGEMLRERNHLSEAVSTRQLTEFPVEIDMPVRLADSIRVPYPAAAMAAGREDFVAVWVVVNSAGAADEIEVTAGSEEFANAVVAALRQAQFLPAQNNLQPIRFPIALQFRFALHADSQQPRAASK